MYKLYSPKYIVQNICIKYIVQNICIKYIV